MFLHEEFECRSRAGFRKNLIIGVGADGIGMSIDPDDLVGMFVHDLGCIGQQVHGLACQYRGSSNKSATSKLERNVPYAVDAKHVSCAGDMRVGRIDFELIKVHVACQQQFANFSGIVPLHSIWQRADTAKVFDDNVIVAPDLQAPSFHGV